MRAAYDVDQVRAAEEPLLKALPEGTLMQRAATALARRCAGLLGSVYGARVVVLAGKGNNGGDARLAGAQLARRGARVDVLRTTDVVDVEAVRALLASAALVIDGMLGIGGSGGLRQPAATVAQLLDMTDAIVVAVDVPSGVDASTGEVAGLAVRADVTVTFGALKT